MSSPPIDTDGDGVPDFRDDDSDNDGVLDADEARLGADRLRRDTDDDGAWDVVEIAAGTDPDDASSEPHAAGHFVFVMTVPPIPRRAILQLDAADPEELVSRLEPDVAELAEPPERSACASPGAACFELTARDLPHRCCTRARTEMHETAWVVLRNGVETARRRVFFVVPALVGYCPGPC